MKKYTNTGSKDTRSGFEGMTELGQKTKVALCADLIGSFLMISKKTTQNVFSKLESQRQT
jgi:hypothetical protein